MRWTRDGHSRTLPHERHEPAGGSQENTRKLSLHGKAGDGSLNGLATPNSVPCSAAHKQDAKGPTSTRFKTKMFSCWSKHRRLCRCLHTPPRIYMKLTMSDPRAAQTGVKLTGFQCSHTRSPPKETAPDVLATCRTATMAISASLGRHET